MKTLVTSGLTRPGTTRDLLVVTAWLETITGVGLMVSPEAVF